MQFEPLVRATPRLLLGMAVVSVVYQLLMLKAFWSKWKNVQIAVMSEDMVTDYWSQFLSHVLDVVFYPLSWVSYAVFLSVMIAIHDRVKKNA